MPITARYRLQMLGFAITLLGLVALLLIPIGARQRAESYHWRIEEWANPAHEQTNEVLDIARETRGYALAYYLGVPQMLPERFASPADYLDSQRERWNAATADSRRVDYCGPRAASAWRAGLNDLGRWMDEYSGRYIAGGPRMTRQELRAADNLFRAGVGHLQAARGEIEKTQGELRNNILDVDRREVYLVVPMVAVCLLLAAWAWYTLVSLHRSEARLATAVRETNHRIKNNLQVLGALLDMRTLAAEDAIPKDAIEDIAGQVKAMAVVHDFLSTHQRADVVRGDQLLRDLVPPAARSARVGVNLKADPITLPSKQAIAVALITNELLLNAGKHGARHASVSLCAENGASARLRVHDDGPGFPAEFNARHDANLGIELVNTLSGHDLNGRVEFASDHGAVVTVTFPLTHAG